MRSKTFFWVPLFFLIFCTSSFAQYSGGTGTLADPYQISSAADLATLMSSPAHWGANFIMTTNIDAAGIVGTAPIGNNGTHFTGTFNGQGNTISNVSMNLPATIYVGLFGYVDGAAISNLGLLNCSILGWSFVGGLCGINDAGTITDCYTTGTVGGTFEFIGGLCGVNSAGEIRDSYSTANTNASNENPAEEPRIVGGFCGWNIYNGLIDNCYATGNVSANWVSADGASVVGGFCGRNGHQLVNAPGTITNCYATGAVFAGHDEVGGFCGINTDGASISGCYATGNATAGNRFAGGFVGVNTVGNPGSGTGPSTITRCYATGSATTGASYAGGFIGRNQEGCIISECYATGNATAGTNAAGGFAGGSTTITSTIINCYSRGSAEAGENWAGGFFGWQEGRITNCYSTGRPITPGANIGGFGGGHGDGGVYTCNFWDVDTSNQVTGISDHVDDQVQGRTTIQMLYQSTFTSYCVWDFDAVWGIMEGRSTPFLLWAPQSPLTAESIPTLNEWGAIIMFALLGGVGLVIARRKTGAGLAS